MLRATSWLQRYTTCGIAHSCFYQALGSVIEDRAGTCELLSAVCVIDAAGAAKAAVLLLPLLLPLLLLCCAALCFSFL